MPNIKVTAMYDEPTFGSIDSLMKRASALKALHEDAEDNYRPLINAVGEKKYELVKQKLYALAEKLAEFNEKFGKDEGIRAIVRVREYTDTSVWIYRNCNNDYRIEIGGRDIELFNKQWIEKDGIITRWGELKVYERLEEALERRIREQISTYTNNIQKIKDNLEALEK